MGTVFVSEGFLTGKIQRNFITVLKFLKGGHGRQLLLSG